MYDGILANCNIALVEMKGLRRLLKEQQQEKELNDADEKRADEGAIADVDEHIKNQDELIQSCTLAANQSREMFREMPMRLNLIPGVLPRLKLTTQRIKRMVSQHLSQMIK